MARCQLQHRGELDSLRRTLDVEEPGWAEFTLRETCRACRVHHTIHPVVGQRSYLGAPPDSGYTPRKGRGLPRAPAGRDPERWCPWHDTESTKISGRCAWGCDAEVHSHRPLLAAAATGGSLRRDQARGWVVERCPACHRDSALLPVAGGRPGRLEVRVMRLVEGRPVAQLSLGGMR